MKYRYEATSIEGFIQQLAVSYVAHGYWFYVAGFVPKGKDPAAVDEKLITKYGVNLSKFQRARRKAAGLANVQYLRCGRFFVLLATHGIHSFFAEEEASIKDMRETPIKFGSYSVSFRSGHPHVRIDRDTYRDFKHYFLDLAIRRSSAELENALGRLPFEPWAPVRRQMLAIVRGINRRRKTAQLKPISTSCLRLRRRVVRPFERPTNFAFEEVVSSSAQFATIRQPS